MKTFTEIALAAAFLITARPSKAQLETYAYSPTFDQPAIQEDCTGGTSAICGESLPPHWTTLEGGNFESLNISGTSAGSGDLIFHDYFTSDGDMTSGTSTILGDTTFSDLSSLGGDYFESVDAFGTSTRLGNVIFQDYSTSQGDVLSGITTIIGQTAFSDVTFLRGDSSESLGISGTSLKIGDFIFHDYSTSGGEMISGTTTAIVDFSFTDLDIE
jgi:hypothetical protein